MKSNGQRRSVKVFDTPSGLGGSHTVEVVADLGNNKVRVRVWYGRATATGWEAWKDWDGYRFETDRASLTNKPTLPLFKQDLGSISMRPDIRRDTIEPLHCDRKDRRGDRRRCRDRL